MVRVKCDCGNIQDVHASCVEPERFFVCARCRMAMPGETRRVADDAPLGIATDKEWMRPELERSRFLHEILERVSVDLTMFRDVMTAAMTGMNVAMARERENTAKIDMALRSALSLVNAERLTDEVRDMLNSVILRALSSAPFPALSEVEKNHIRRAVEADDRTRNNVDNSGNVAERLQT